MRLLQQTTLPLLTYDQTCPSIICLTDVFARTEYLSNGAVPLHGGRTCLCHFSVRVFHLKRHCWREPGLDYRVRDRVVFCDTQPDVEKPGIRLERRIQGCCFVSGLIIAVAESSSYSELLRGGRSIHEFRIYSNW